MKTIHPFNYSNPSLCTLCRGKCCKQMPGQYSPDDFKEPITYEFLKGLLEAGSHSIDWHEDPEIYYIRPRSINGEKIDPSYGGQCINLTDTGCSLPEEVRPLQCRMLEPKGKIGSLNCKSPKGFGKLEMASLWNEHQGILIKLKDEYYEWI